MNHKAFIIEMLDKIDNEKYLRYIFWFIKEFID